jgi:hypothetical protein
LEKTEKEKALILRRTPGVSQGKFISPLPILSDAPETFPKNDHPHYFHCGPNLLFTLSGLARYAISSATALPMISGLEYFRKENCRIFT